MTTPVLALPPCDVEANLWELLKAGGGTKLFTYDVQTRAHHYAQTHSVQIDSRAANKKAGHDLAWATLATVLSLGGTVWQDGVVSDVALVTGPSWLPDENGAPRYTARYALTVHPRSPSS